MKILVTGSEGFLGSEIINALSKRKISIFGLSKNKKKNKNNKYKLINSNLLNLEKNSQIFKNNKFDMLIHCAWYTNPKDYLHSKKNTEWLKASKKLIDEFYRYGGKQFIGIGTNAEFNTSNKKNKVFEKKFSKGAETLYGKSKSKLNNYLLSKYKNAKWIRIFWLFGKNEKKERFLKNMISMFRKNKNFFLEYPSIKRDYISTEQAAKLIVDIIFKKKNGQSFNVCNGKSLSLKEIAFITKKQIKSGKLILSNNKYDNEIIGETKKISKFKNYKNYNVKEDLINHINHFYK